MLLSYKKFRGSRTLIFFVFCTMWFFSDRWTNKAILHLEDMASYKNWTIWNCRPQNSNTGFNIVVHIFLLEMPCLSVGDIFHPYEVDKGTTPKIKASTKGCHLKVGAQRVPRLRVYIFPLLKCKDLLLTISFTRKQWKEEEEKEIV